MQQNIVRPLTRAQVEHYVENGWLIADTLDAEFTQDLRRWVDEVQSWPMNGEWFHYEEMTDTGPQLCRTEYFTPFHAGLRDLLIDGHMIESASALLGERAVLYKEKINYKLAGGAGYSAHQDAPAYRFIDIHISCMIAVDDSTIENGCLEVVSGAHQVILPMDDNGCINKRVEDGMDWFPVELRAGQTLWFHSRTPHRSRDNQSNANRRALYPTYNAFSEGDLRERYYAQKLQEFGDSKSNGSTVQVSLISDFRGKPVPQ